MKTAWFYIGIVSTLGIVGCGAGAARNEVAQTALDKLEAVDAAISISTNISNYGQLLVDAKPAIDDYLEVDSGSEFSKAVSNAFDGHRLAFDWWQCKFEKSETGDSFYDFQAQAECRDSLLPALTSLYPDVGAEVDQAVEKKNSELEKPLDYQSDALDPDSIIQVIWQRTSADTETAKTLLE